MCREGGNLLKEKKLRYWKRINKDGTATVESYSHNSEIAEAVEITEQDFNEFVATLPIETLPEPSMSVTDQLQDIKQRVANLEARISGQ